MHNTIVLLKVACTSSLHKPYISPQKHRLSQLQSIEYSEILSSVEMRRVLLLVTFFTPLLEVNCEVQCESYPCVTFMGQTLANHSSINHSRLGDDENETLKCHTDLSTCCIPSQGAHRGDWYFPNDSIVPTSGGIYESRDAQAVKLHRREGILPSGVYRCKIPTARIHENTDTSVRDTIYVELSKGKNTHASI